MVNNTKKPKTIRVNQSLEKKLAKYTSEALVEIGKDASVADSFLRENLYSKFQELYNSVSANQNLALDYRSKLDWGRVHAGDIVSYLHSKVDQGCVSEGQAEKIRNYAEGLCGILDKHVEKANAKRVRSAAAREERKSAQKEYLSAITKDTTTQIAKIIGETNNVHYQSFTLSGIKRISMLIDGTATKKGKRGFDVLVRNYKERIELIDQEAKAIVRAADAEFKKGTIGADDAYHIVNKTMKFLGKLSESPYQTRTKREGYQRSHNFDLFEKVKEFRSYRDYFKSEKIIAFEKKRNEYFERLEGLGREMKNRKDSPDSGVFVQPQYDLTFSLAASNIYENVRKGIKNMMEYSALFFQRQMPRASFFTRLFS